MELLAPAGDADSLQAALAMGADAVYFGLDCGFNARGRTSNFGMDTLEETISLIHSHGARAYLTVNTLVFEPELKRVATVLRRASECGVDAFIIQDPAVALLARIVAPDVERHASTQMTISSGDAARFAESLGISRIVVPRELRTAEIARMAHDTDIELEVFIHGALCVAWSGQCLTSEAWAGRSANRGQCNQACRMPYDLVVDGEPRDLGEYQYLLSPGDLMGADSVAELNAAGVVTLKIEGRQKGVQYVATATKAYRNLLDSIETDSKGALRQFHEDSHDLSLSYSRGFGSGFLDGINHQQLVDGRFPKHRGLLLGEVMAVDDRSVTVQVPSEPTMTMDASKLTRGMGVVFDAGQPEDKSEPGGPIFDHRTGEDGVTHLLFGEPGPDLGRVHVGNRVWVTSDPSIGKAVRGQLNKRGRTGRCTLTMEIHGKVGEPLSVTARSARGETAVATSQSSLERASSGGLDRSVLQEKLGALGDTPYFLNDLITDELEGGCFLPVKELKSIRRDLLSQLNQTGQPTVERPSPDGAVAKTIQSLELEPRDATEELLLPLCRTTPQLEAVIEAGLSTVELDFMELVGLKKAVKRAREAGLHVVVASLRVQKPGEDGFGAALEQVRADAVLVRHWGALELFRNEKHAGLELHGDFSLNVTNSITARHLLRHGLSTVTASHDLDRDQLMQLAAALPSGVLTIPVQHRTPTFHTEHCVYAHVLSEGTTHLDCGRPCEKHELSLIDHKGLEHPVIVDAACRNTVFNGEAHSAGWMIPELREMGVHRFRIEFVRESQAETARVLEAWQNLLRGDHDSESLARETGTREQFGVAEGGMVIAPMDV